MKSVIAITYCAGLALLGSLLSASAADKFTARTFAGADQKLNQQEAAFYIVFRDKEPLSKFLSPGEMTLDPKKVVAAMADKLDDLRSLTGHGSPWTWQELDAVAAQTAKVESLPAWEKISGVTTKAELGKGGANGSLGPFRLRKTSADLTKALKDASGATIGYSDNRLLQGNGAWNAQGALDYPVKVIHQGGSGQSIELEVGPAVEWNLAQVQGNSKKDVQALTFSLPMTVYASPGREKMTGTYEENIAAAGNEIFSALWVIQAKPYFQTDFSFQQEIYGVEASAEFVGGLLGSNIYLGGFQNIGKSGLQYQLRAIPKLDYSETERGGLYTTRKKGDDWFRAGGTVSLDLRLGGKSFNPLDFGVSYQFLDTLSGSGDFSDLFKAHATWWLTENAGITLEYSKGDTPVADKKIDLLTLGLEVKY